MNNPHHHIYLSPHYDDASLSCGGAIHQQTQAEQPVLVITICAAPPKPGEPLSPFAQRLHAAWGNPENVVAARQIEDQASLEVLGADYRRLDFTDCIYRGQPEQGQWYYNNDDQLFGQIHPAELALPIKMAEIVAEMVPAKEEVTLYAPLTVGHHVDHQLVHAAAWRLRQQGWTVAFYEDYPYADPNYPLTRSMQAEPNPYNLEATLARQQTAHLQPQLRFISEENLEAKMESVRAYASQLRMLFGGETEMQNYLRQYALNVGQGRLAERVWIPAVSHNFNPP